MHFSLSTYAELFALIISVVTFPRLSMYLKALAFLVLLTVLVEVGSELKLTTWHESNNWIYNLFTTVEFVFFGCIYFRIYRKTAFRSVLPYLLVTLVLLVALNLVFVQGFWHFHSYTFMLGSLLVILCAIQYLAQGITNDEAYEFMKDPFFWVSIGLLLFYSGQFTVMMFYAYMTPLKLRAFGTFFRLLMDVINLLEYGLFSMAFIIDARTGRNKTGYIAVNG